MKNLPQKIEVSIEPVLLAGYKQDNTVQMMIRVEIGDHLILYRKLKPFDFFLSNFDLAMDSAKEEIKKELEKFKE